MTTDLISSQARAARQLMDSQDPEGKLSYHNWKHVATVMRAVEELCSLAKIDGEQAEDLMLAAIWHDADYGQGSAGHEARSAGLAEESLLRAGHSPKRIGHVRSLITATEMGYAPKTKEECIIKDADLAHIGSTDYLDFYNGLYEELQEVEGKKMTADEWRDNCLQFISSHRYHTQEARELWTEVKEDNYKKITALTRTTTMTTEETGIEGEKKKKKKKDKPNYNAEKGIETMFRVSLRNHINLSRIADDKANTLISVNAIILSIVLSALFPKMDSNPWLIYPGMALILVSILTIILSTLSTIPKTTHGEVSIDDVNNKRGNLLFFGNFHKMSLAEFEYGIGELMKDGSYLYGSLTRDLYFLGKVLNRKYGLLRRAYLVFVIGLVISIGLFIWSILTLAPHLAKTTETL